MTRPSLDIIIVNWNAGSQLRECVDSIRCALNESFSLRRVVVVDNGSADGSADALQADSLPLELIHNSTNRGFAAACNQGARGSHADYLLFLNPDTRLFARSLSAPLDFMEGPSGRRIGIVGIRLVDEHDCAARTCSRLPSPGLLTSQMLGVSKLMPRLFPGPAMHEWDHEDSRSVPQIMGAFFLIRRFLFEELDGFDEQFFVYFEEVDLSARAHEAGWESYFLSTAQAYHRGGGTSEPVKPTRLFYVLRSRILYAFKHFGMLPATWLACGTLMLEPWIRISWALARGAGDEARATIVAYGRLWTQLPVIYRLVMAHRRP